MNSLFKDYRLTEEWRLVGEVVGVASRHLVCTSCVSWIQYDSSGCDTAWAETREGVAALLRVRGAGRWS